MRLAELASAVGSARVVGDGEAEFSDVVYDSRQVTPGALFVAVVGLRDDGHRYLREAQGKGAAAAVVQRPETLPEGLPALVVPDSRAALPRIAGVFFDYPWSRLRLIGVTGTNGKTTTTFLIRSLLREAGRRVGLIGTVEVAFAGECREAVRTTPESVDLCRLFRQMVDRGVEDVVMEVASHALALGRVAGMEFDVAVFTNLTQDHLDFHGTMERYRDAKALLFRALASYDGPRPKGGVKLAVVNADDPHGSFFAEAAQGARIVTYGLGEGAQVTGRDVRVAPDGVSFRLVVPGGEVPVSLALTGAFNVQNALAAAGVGFGLGIPLEQVAAGLAAVTGVPGRFERVDLGQPFTVIVDYAHTPDGLMNVLRTARHIARGRVLVVFGCGGDRDRGKRPKMGEIATRLADATYLTSDNPRSEDPEAILAEIAVGARAGGGPFFTFVDRTEAIGAALGEAQPGDVVVIAGKGHETYQILRDRTIPYDDREVARSVLRRLGYGGTDRG